MAISLSDFRDQVRNLLLADAIPDDNGDFKFVEPQFKYAVWWATDQFANHTAQPSSVTFTTPTTYTYQLPDNRYEGDKIDTSGQVFLLHSDLTTKILDPIEYTENLERDTGAGFYTYPDDVLNITTLPLSTDILTVRYFAYYDHPQSDDDLIRVPRWAIMPLAYLAASHILSNESLKTANIRQYAADEDKGTPEHNPLLKQQMQYLAIYDREIAKHMPQDRTNMFRQSETN